MNGLFEYWWIVLSRPKTNVLKQSINFLLLSYKSENTGCFNSLCCFEQLPQNKEENNSSFKMLHYEQKKGKKNLNIKETFPTISDITNM